MLKPNLKEMCFFHSHFLWPKKKKKNPDSSWQFEFYLSTLGASHTAELDSLVKQTSYRGSIMLPLQNRKLGWVMVEGWFYIMREAGGSPHRPAGSKLEFGKAGPFGGSSSHPRVSIQLGQLPPQIRMARLLALEKGGPHVWHRIHLYLWESTALRGSCQTPSPLIHSPPGLWGEFASGPRVGGPNHRGGAPLTSETTKGKGSIQRVQMWTIRMHRGRLVLTILPRLCGRPTQKRLGLPFVPMAPTTTKNLPEGHWEVHIWEIHHFPALEKRPEQPNLGFTLGSWTWLASLWKSKPQIGPQRALCCSFMKL